MSSRSALRRSPKPGDLTATICHLLGIHPGGTFHDREGREHRITEGTPIHKLLGTEAATDKRTTPGGDIVRLPPYDPSLLLNTEFEDRVGDLTGRLSDAQSRLEEEVARREAAETALAQAQTEARRAEAEPKTESNQTAGEQEDTNLEELIQRSLSAAEERWRDQENERIEEERKRWSDEEARRLLQGLGMPFRK